MRYSQSFSKTSKTTPHDANSVNAKLLTQAGFIDKQAAGIYNLLPLGLRVLQKINQIIREEMNGVGGQEILMPALHPIDIWEKTGRNRTMDDVLYRTKGAGDKDFVFGPSHEETVTPLAAKFVNSYKDLPKAVYQIQTKFRDEPRAKSGMLRGREFGMKDMYSFHTKEEDLDEYYEKVKEAYLRVYERCGLKAYVVEASGGAFSDKFSHEFSIETEAGEDTIIFCPKCEIAQNLEVAEGKIKDPDEPEEEEKEMKEVEVERGPTVEANAKAHNVHDSKILKTVVYAYEGGYLGVVIRGDLQINEEKLVRYLGKHVKAASPAELKELGLVQGFISPVGLSKVEGGLKHAAEVKADGKELDIPFIADHSIKGVKNYVTGANKAGVDLVNVNLGRDFFIEDFTDLVAVTEGFACNKCGGALQEITAVEAGNIFKLGTKFAKDFDLKFTDEDGTQKPVIMGCYGIGNTRLLGTIVEAMHDDNGIIWPKSVAPFAVHIVRLGPDQETVKAADKLYDELTEQGVEVLYDDREESAGIKFNDADLIGIPLRLVVSSRNLKDGKVEWKERSESEGKQVDLNETVDEVIKWLNN